MVRETAILVRVRQLFWKVTFRASDNDSVWKADVLAAVVHDQEFTANFKES